MLLSQKQGLPDLRCSEMQIFSRRFRSCFRPLRVPSSKRGKLRAFYIGQRNRSIRPG